VFFFFFFEDLLRFYFSRGGGELLGWVQKSRDGIIMLHTDRQRKKNNFPFQMFSSACSVLVSIFFFSLLASAAVVNHS